MNYEYNGNLLEDERINLVAKEILTKYPVISKENAINAAMLEGKIDKEKSLDMELNRLYNIMLVNSYDKNIVKIVYNDYLNILKQNYIEEDNIHLIIEKQILDYLNGFSTFPIISDFINN